MKKLILVLSMMLFCLSAITAQAADLKVGVLNLHAVMEQSPQAVKIRKQMRGKFQPRADKIKMAALKLKKETKKFYRDNAIMTQDKRQKMEKRIRTAQRDLQMAQYKLEKDISVEQRKVMKSFLKIVHEQVDRLAKKSNFDIIMLSDRVPFSKKKLEVTDEILAMMKKAAK